MEQKNSHVLNGISELVNFENVRRDVNIKTLERQLLTTNSEPEDIKSPDERLSEALKDIEKGLGIKFEEKHLGETDDASDEEDDDARHDSSGGHRSPPSTGHHNEEYDKKEDKKNEDEHSGTGGGFSRSILSDDKDLGPRTAEQDKRQIIGKLIHSPADVSFEENRQDDLRYKMLAEIDSLSKTLQDDGECLDRVPQVDRDSTFEEIEGVLKLLRRKNDVSRYRSLAEEGLLLTSYGLESMFDGKRQWFGRYRPNLEGWHTHVNMKLRRMRHDTGQVVSDIMQEYNIGPFTRILLELVPSMFIYSRTRSQNYSPPTAQMTDEEMKLATRELRNMTDT